jgi:hypothetical protein
MTQPANVEYLFLNRREQKVAMRLKERDEDLELFKCRGSENTFYLVTDDNGGFQFETLEEVEQFAEYGRVIQ